jgi:hypothetical protein
MPETNESRVGVSVGGRHSEGRRFHFAPISQDDRIRKIFGLVDESALPLVRQETLIVYHDYLLTQLSLPFEAMYCPPGGEARQLISYLQVTTLVDPRRSRNHSLHGLLCQARNHKEVLDLPLSEVGVREDNLNCTLLDDYAYWFVNCR